LTPRQFDEAYKRNRQVRYCKICHDFDERIDLVFYDVVTDFSKKAKASMHGNYQIAPSRWKRGLNWERGISTALVVGVTAMAPNVLLHRNGFY